MAITIIDEPYNMQYGQRSSYKYSYCELIKI